MRFLFLFFNSPFYRFRSGPGANRAGGVNDASSSSGHAVNSTDGGKKKTTNSSGGSNNVSSSSSMVNGEVGKTAGAPVQQVKYLLPRARDSVFQPQPDQFLFP